MKKYFYNSLFLLGFMILGGHGACAESIGSVSQVSGDVWLMQDSKAWRLAKGDEVDSQHTIITEKGGATQVLLHDGTLLSIGPRTRIKLEAYKVKEKESFSFDVLWGAVRYVVKKIIDPDAAFNVKTTTAAIGVRGTEFLVSIPHPEHINGLRFSPSANLSSIGLQTTTVDMKEGLAVLTDLKGIEHPLPAGTITTVDKDANVIQVVKGAPVAVAPKPVAAKPTPPPVIMPEKPSHSAQDVGSKAAVTTGANASAIHGVTSFGGR
jgi:hypothetical protein